MSKNSSQPQIEIEFRALLTKEKYNELKKFFDQNAKDLGEDSKDTRFFLLPDRFAKVVNNTTKKTAKLVLKLNRMSMGGSDFEEVEVSINPADFEKAVKMFSALPFDEIQDSYQERHNYFYEGVEFALKYTKSWGYHLELEVLVDSLDQKDEAEKKIHKLAKKLGINILSDEELKKLAKQIDDNYRKAKYINGDSLHNLAEKSTTPQHEYMDQETLDWVLKNRFRVFDPKFDWGVNLLAVNEKFKKINIDPLWFEPQERAIGIHGIRHLLRVCLNCLVIAQTEKLDNRETDILVIAALTHDLRRNSDKNDSDHAKRSSDWLLKNKDTIEKYTNIGVDDASFKTAAELVKLHEIKKEVLEKNSKYSQVKKIVDVLRVADALDRYIQPKLTWWPDYNLLPMKIDNSLKLFAYEMIVSSEHYFLKGMESNKCVHFAFEKLL